MGLEWIMTVWPWMGLGAAIALLFLLFGTKWLQVHKGRSRWRDPSWFAWLCSVAYMIHNVEEYGFDATGSVLAFPHMMEGMMGSMPEWTFFLSVNIGLVWVLGPLAAFFSRKYPKLAFAMVGIEAVNCLTHIPGAIALGSISGGFVTAAAVFLPLTVWAFVGLCGKGEGRFSYRTLLCFIGVGLFYHIGLFANMPFFVNGIYDGNVMGLEMVFVAAITFGLWMWLARRTSESARFVSGGDVAEKVEPLREA